MARIDDIERRLLNWARWRLGGSGGGLGYSSVDLTLANAGRDGYAEARIPTLDVEAEETDQGVMALESHLRATVEVVYLAAGPTREKAKRLCCAESTLFARVDQAHYLLASWLSAKARAARDHRQRVEALQQAARPVAPALPEKPKRKRRGSFTQ